LHSFFAECRQNRPYDILAPIYLLSWFLIFIADLLDCSSKLETNAFLAADDTFVSAICKVTAPSLDPRPRISSPVLLSKAELAMPEPRPLLTCFQLTRVDSRRRVVRDFFGIPMPFSYPNMTRFSIDILSRTCFLLQLSHLLMKLDFHMEIVNMHHQNATKNNSCVTFTYIFLEIICI
jgi:hypothetical protein